MLRVRIAEGFASGGHSLVAAYKRIGYAVLESRVVIK